LKNKTNNKVKVIALKCPNCGDIIYSRARHDFISCSCKSVSLDGGFDYIRGAFNPKIIKEFPKTFELEIESSREELYKDWNFQTNKFGIIKKHD